MERTNRGAEWRHGWPPVLAPMMGLRFGPGLFQNLSSLFTIPMIASFGWTRGEIATAAALLLTAFGASQVAGRFANGLLVDRYRPQVMAAAVALTGNAAGIGAFGRLHDATGDYAVALALATVALMLAAIAFLSLHDRNLPVARAAAA